MFTIDDVTCFILSATGHFLGNHSIIDIMKREGFAVHHMGPDQPLPKYVNFKSLNSFIIRRKLTHLVVTHFIIDIAWCFRDYSVVSAVVVFLLVSFSTPNLCRVVKPCWMSSCVLRLRTAEHVKIKISFVFILSQTSFAVIIILFENIDRVQRNTI